MLDMTMPPPLLDVRGVTLQYKTRDHLVTATYRVHFSVHRSDRMVVFQEFDQLLPWKTVRQNVVFALTTSGKLRGKAADEKAMQGLPDPVRRRLSPHPVRRHEVARRHRPGGLGQTPRLVFVPVHSVLWAITLNTHAAFRGVSQTLRMVGCNHGLSSLPLVLKILVPAAFPSILTGLKTC